MGAGVVGACVGGGGADVVVGFVVVVVDGAVVVDFVVGFVDVGFGLDEVVFGFVVVRGARVVVVVRGARVVGAVRVGAVVGATVVASAVGRLDEVVDVPGYGQVRYDIAYGGNFYAIVHLEDLGIDFQRRNGQRMLDAGLAIMDAINAQNPVRHPENPDINVCHHVYLEAPGSTAQHSRHAMAIHPGWFDRSPCGTGTSARMAQLHARRLLGVDEPFVNESFIGSRFIGRIAGETTVGDRPGIRPTVTGRAWVTGTAQYMLDPSDPFPRGFTI